MSDDFLTAEELGLARRTFAQLESGIPQWVRDGLQIRIFPWTGTAAMITLSLCAKISGLQCQTSNLSLLYQNITPEELTHHFQEILDGKFSPIELAEILPNPFLEKYDQFLVEKILSKTNSIRSIALQDAQKVAFKFLMR